MWCYGIVFVPVTTATIAAFTVPFFTLILAPFFLGEKVGIHLWIAVIIGFIGVVIVFNPDSADFNPSSLLMIVSAVAFAILDIINKKFIVKESLFAMIFYSALVTAILGIYPGLKYWTDPTLKEVAILLLLGAGGNAILYCILKAFSVATASSLSPFKYLELLFSMILGYLVFGEVPGMNTFIGSAIIIPCTLFVVYMRTSQEEKSVNDHGKEENIKKAL